MKKLIVVLCIAGFLFGCSTEKDKELERLRKLEDGYRKVVAEKSREVTKDLFTYKNTDKVRIPGLSATRPETTTYRVTDAGIIGRTEHSGGWRQEFYWYANLSSIDSGYCGEEDYCIIMRGNFRENNSHDKSKCLCFHKGIRRDEFHRASNNGLSQFREKWKALY